MRIRIAWWIFMAVSLAAPALAETSVSVQLNIGNAPPPPVVVYRDVPHMVVVPGSTVYVVSDDRCDYDFFRYGVYWYIWNDGYWYRARTYRGPFAVIEARYVPGRVWNVPAKHWKHHPHGGPPGLMKMKRHDDMVVVKEKGGKGHGRWK